MATPRQQLRHQLRELAEYVICELALPYHVWVASAYEAYGPPWPEGRLGAAFARKWRAQHKAEFVALFQKALERAREAARRLAERDARKPYHCRRSQDSLVAASFISRLARVVEKEWIKVKDLNLWNWDLEEWLPELLEPELVHAIMQEVDRRMVKHAQKLGHIAIRGDFYSPTPKKRWSKIYQALHVSQL